MKLSNFQAALAERFDEKQVRFYEPMSKHTTFKVGGPVDAVVFPTTIDDIRDAIQIAEGVNQPWHVIGKGSNLLVSDEGLEGLVLVFVENYAQIEIEGTKILAQAGATNKQVAEAARDAGLAGYEFASGIPGTIGGAAFMNAGAYDGEFKNVATAVTCLMPDGSIVALDASEADWSYRHSSMQDSNAIILDATLELKPENREVIASRIADLTDRRESKQPLDLGSAGSTFKRPEGSYAAKLIDEAGMRGHRVGGAQVSTKHCGFVVNTGSATAYDVMRVIEDVQKAVFESSGIHLEPEVRMWGFKED